MPILHTQLSGKANLPNGQAITIPPGVALAQRGPVAQVAIGLSKAVANQWALQGLSLPNLVSGLALFDTGASVTCIDDAAAKQLNLPVVNVVTIASASHAATQQNVYPVSVEFVGATILIENVLAVGAPLNAQGLIALIGRDVLRAGTLHYNGIVGEFTLAV